jgi:hypothetical protein
MFGGIELVGVHDSHLISGFLRSNFSLNAVLTSASWCLTERVHEE